MSTAVNYTRFKWAIAVAFVIALSWILAGCAGVVSGKSSNTTTPPPSGDTTPPTVSITSPAANAVLSGSVNVTADASDNVAVAGVQFKVDGANTGAAVTAAPYAYVLNTTLLAKGAHTISATATDTAGNTANSSQIAVTVDNSTADTTPPTVSITSPTNSATVTGTITISANASDNVSVASVQFQLDGANLGSADLAAPYTTSWNTTSATNGPHSLRAIAKDGASNSTTSAAISVTVSNTGTTDTTPPSVPTGLVATAISSTQIGLSWSASTDNVAVTGYNIFRNGAKISTSSSTSFSDSGLTASTSYTYEVSAFDAAGNTSAQSQGAAATTLAASSGGTIGSAVGWYDLGAATQIQPNCPSPSPGGNTGCPGVIEAQSGGIADTINNRMIIWGGGHQDYYGNEVYAISLNANPMSAARIIDPTPAGQLNFTGCQTTGDTVQPDGHPTSRHTYSNLVFIPTIGPSGQMFSFAGALANCGYSYSDTWTLDLATLVWTHVMDQNTAGQPAQCNACVNDWDPNTNQVFLFDTDTSTFANVWSYDPVGKTYTARSPHNSVVSNLQLGGGIDVGRKLFLVAGSGKFFKVDISSGSSYTIQDIHATVTGCSVPMSATSPGFAWDPVSGNDIWWQGGGTVYAFNPDTNTCTAQTFPNGPPSPPHADPLGNPYPAGSAQLDGTFGRFRYMPALGVFVVVNDTLEDAYALRMVAASGGTGSGPAISNLSVASITTVAAVVNWSTNVGATSQVEYGTSTSYGTLTPLDSTLLTNHSVALAGLSANTLYHYRVHSKDTNGVESISNDAAFQTNNTTDTTAPTISITTPANGATVSGSITVSGTAADNVGVTSVQFLLDGNNLGSAISAAPYQVTWDTTTASNASHILSANAFDAAGNVGNAVAITVTVSNSGSGGAAAAAQDFQNRCSAPGVIVCDNLSSSAGLPQRSCSGSTSVLSGLFVDCFDATSVFGTVDSTTYTSGGGSLLFTIPSNAGSDPTGYYRRLFAASQDTAPSGATIFGENSDFYFQFRQRMDSAYLTNNWPAVGGGKTYWKQFIAANDTASCAQEDLVLVNDNNEGFPLAYSQCGALPFQKTVNSTLYNEFTQNLVTGSGESGYNCAYNSAQPNANCFDYPVDTWVTYYFHVHLGNWGVANSLVEGWVATPSAPTYKQWLYMNNLTYNQDPGVPGFDEITLIAYWTKRDPSISAGPVSHTWYNELIVSSQPIAAPAAAPAAP